MRAPATYTLWILCDVGFLRRPDQRLVMALGLGGEDPGWVATSTHLDGAFVARVTDLITDATTVVFDVPREVSAQLERPAVGGAADPIDEVARQRLIGWRGAASVTHRRLETRLAEVAPPAGSSGGDDDRHLLAAARVLANPTTHVVMLHSNPWIDAQLATSPTAADRRIHTEGHLAPLEDIAVLASRDQRARRQQHERGLMTGWAMIVLGICLMVILAIAVLPVALAWDGWRVPLWTVAGGTGLAWLWFAARTVRHLRVQSAS